MNQEFELIAKTFQGLEEILAQELTELGAGNIQIGRRMVSFTGDKTMMYRANFNLRTAIRVLKPIKHFQATNADEVYNAVKAIAWENYMDNTTSFSVDAVVFSEVFRHSKFVAYKVKDAIVDYFREKTGSRPSVRINNPDLALNIHIAEDQCTLSLDSSGESLHRRGYRQEQVEAPLNEVLAAGMILMTGWRGECDLIDPMCGSGTIPIEAALIARNIAPGVFRKEFAFEKWKDFDKELLDSIYNDDSQEREFTHKIYGYDNNPKANEIATHNVKAAGLTKDIVLKVQAFQQFEQPKEKSLIIMNPPYGERISSDDLLGLYQMIGERLKHAFTGNDAWILSYRDECFDQIGLKASVKIPLFNGALECQFRKYQLFDGKYREFRSENPDKEFKPKGEEKIVRARHHGEKVEYGRREGKERFRDSARREWDKPGFRPREDRRREEDDRRSFRPRRAEDGKEFTRERKQAFNREEPKRFSRNEESDKLARIPANLRYMHRRRKPEEEN
ncbi:THUMP domain-containing protein [Bacteroides gallinaceum]|uniref:THUMP domain-containing protein n=2 Tax=Bacteroidaceae TaxID=815 RepID=A0ABT7X989_9BACE|nr:MULTISPECIES: THUMP domain-containing protein [Bacteroidaceae]CCZ69997.1 rRNA (Guanine-N(2)-)-methyltransferase [Bacteroides sp. CAG:702]MBD8040768.1 RNA methyltransferase [Phocaeicola intestinalis]MBM6657292.1 RNA methyltransferase [Bacteroides gallinaceum]MBM6721063.1 RNA methyltransferase [Bacteroides gallinaceum]MBM6945361.1 RNA methyltransferase [Bacteroides gallinaceum]